MFDPSSFANPTPLAHADASRDVLPRVRTSQPPDRNIYSCTPVPKTSQKNSKTLHPDEEHKPRLPDSIARPITNMPLSRMKNTTFVKPSIIDFHDMRLRTVLTVRMPKEQRLFNAYCLFFFLSLLIKEAYLFHYSDFCFSLVLQ
ncbi:hypothetical protein TNCV_4057661 [Trichonephila clavipes]|nr:hypothetical protein TNCV_4057661 [Trichonephila clavipes]